MREYAERARIERFLRAVGHRLRSPLRLYLVGGSVVVDMGLRDATLVIDFVAQADDPRALEEFERLLPQLKSELSVNAEPASPADYLPIPRDILDRSPYVRSYGNLHVYYYDLPSILISKAARGAERDLNDIEAVVRSGAVSWEEIDSRWKEIRESPRGWLHYTPDVVQQRLQNLRERLGTLTSLSGASASSSSPRESVHVPEYRRRDGRVVREHWRRRRKA